MSKKLFVQIHNQKKRKINISIDSDLKAKLEDQKSIDSISISERIEDLYRQHREDVENIIVSDSLFPRSRGERGKPMFSNRLRSTCGIFLTPDAIAFFDLQAKKNQSDRSKIIELALKNTAF
ncbi:MAG: hypothetical protein QNJ55_12975 [Xenococcus sp. MO_188.B8]|nr:hypothetical protein [Xenococcus sp. MO_188.B8]